MLSRVPVMVWPFPLPPDAHMIPLVKPINLAVVQIAHIPSFYMPVTTMAPHRSTMIIYFTVGVATHTSFAPKMASKT